MKYIIHEIENNQIVFTYGERFNLNETINEIFDYIAEDKETETRANRIKYVIEVIK